MPRAPSLPSSSSSSPRVVVLDSNVVLDLFVFDDASVRALRASIERGAVRWIATATMRDELARVLGYPRIAGWLARRGHLPEQAALDALGRFDRNARLVPTPAAAAPLACSDADDQMFIDLAFAHRAELLSKDHAVRAVWRRLDAFSQHQVHDCAPIELARSGARCC